MAKLRNNLTAYGRTPNELLNDKTISLKAKGLFAFMESKPDDWSFSVTKIGRLVKESRDAVAAGLIELESSGYLTRSRYQDSSGYWQVEYSLTDRPSSDIPTTENPSQENPSTENTLNISNKDITNKDITNKDLSTSQAASGSDEQSLTPAKEIDSEAYEIVDQLDRLVARVVDREPRKRTEKQRRDAALDIERLHRIDGRSYEQISGIMRWALQDDFWRNNIQSTATLRKQFDKLYAKAKSEAEKRSQQVAVIS